VGPDPEMNVWPRHRWHRRTTRCSGAREAQFSSFLVVPFARPLNGSVRRLIVMSTDIQKIINTLNGIDSVEDEHQLQALEESVQQLFSSSYPEPGIDALFGILERFPDKDGYGIFWGILNGLERLSNYQDKLIESIRRRPSEFSLLMVNRILNTGQMNVNGIDLLDLLEEVASSNNWPESIKKTAGEFIEWQRNRA
jgi:hypothetical protein